MWTAHWWIRLRCGIVSVVIVMAAFECLPARGQATVSLKLIQTLSNAEFASYVEPFSNQGVLAVRVGAVVQLWDTQTGTLKATLPHHEKILEASFSADGETFITSSREKPAGLITRLWNVQTGRLEHTLFSAPTTTVEPLSATEKLKKSTARSVARSQLLCFDPKLKCHCSVLSCWRELLCHGGVS